MANNLRHPRVSLDLLKGFRWQRGSHRPHSAHHLRDGLLVAPLGPQAVLDRGAYYLVLEPGAGEREVVQQFVRWLREEIRRDADIIPSPAPQLAAPKRMNRR